MKLLIRAICINYVELMTAVWMLRKKGGKKIIYFVSAEKANNKKFPLTLLLFGLTLEIKDTC